MKKTDYVILCGTQNGYPVYRTVMQDGDRYFIRWKGKIIDVTNDKESFRSKSLMTGKH